jgi:Spy/CpxP family protein refolding chaperone
MKSAILTAAAACLIAVPIAFGLVQNNPNRTSTRHYHGTPDVAARVERRVERLTRMLSLNDSQQQQATSIFTNAAKADTPVMADMHTARQNLAKTVTTNEPSLIKQYATTIGNDTGTLVANEASAFSQFYEILTPEQQTKLSQLHQAAFMRGFGSHRTM